MATSGFATLVLSDIPVSTVRVSLLGRRKEILHKRWDENVYQPIQDQINRKLNAEYDSFLERKINIYDQYLNVSIICYLKKRMNFQKFRLLTKNRYAIVRLVCKIALELWIGHSHWSAPWANRKTPSESRVFGCYFTRVRRSEPSKKFTSSFDKDKW